MAEIGASGFLAPGEAAAIAELLRQAPEPSLLDVGCGNGRLGLWLAERARTRRYCGLDVDPACIASARALTPPAGLSVLFIETGFESYSNDGPAWGGALAHDSLYLARSPGPALRSVARALGPGAPLVFTAYVGSVEEGAVHCRDERTWIEALLAASFRDIQITDLSEEWRRWGSRVHAERLRAAEALVSEMGALAAAPWLRISRRMLGQDGRPPFLLLARRIRIVARMQG